MGYSWFVGCVDFRWVLLGSLAALICRWVLRGSAMISVGRFLAAVRHCCFALATVARFGLPVALVSVGSSWFVGCVYVRWALLGGCLALLLCVGVRCSTSVCRLRWLSLGSSWFIGCVGVCWVLLCLSAAFIFVG